MATGDQNDIANRLNAVLPPWFGSSETPILTGILAAFSESGSVLYSEIAYVQLQTRITSATDINLDQIALDFFGLNNFLRNPGENDASYRARIIASILHERATRRGMVTILTLLTGQAPVIFEPMRPADGGGYAIAGCGYDVAGGWSNPNVPYQCFIKVFTPVIPTISSLAGWNIPTGAWNTPSYEAWNTNINSSYSFQIAQIYQAINNTKQEGTICWTQVVNS